jgi:gamma-glutamyltranspeptidase
LQGITETAKFIQADFAAMKISQRTIQTGLNPYQQITGVMTSGKPPNGQGIATLQMLNIIEAYDFSKIPLVVLNPYRKRAKKTCF